LQYFLKFIFELTRFKLTCDVYKKFNLFTRCKFFVNDKQWTVLARKMFWLCIRKCRAWMWLARTRWHRYSLGSQMLNQTFQKFPNTLHVDFLMTEMIVGFMIKQLKISTQRRFFNLFRIWSV